nr:reverse transcriptase domain-containing protein [Tanacetum cinerariifolium]GEZ64364.1 reverse transcriptase domain-containing protein [Tanacetum cinerariifolium]
MPGHSKTCDGSEDPEDHLKIFQAAAKTERWKMPTWCHMFNFTLTENVRVWFDDLPQESIDSYDDLKKAFIENYIQQKNASRIRLKFTTSSREIWNPQKSSCRDTNLNAETGDVAASIHERMKTFPSWKQDKVHPPYKGTKINFCFRQRKVQTAPANDNPREEDGMEGPMIIKAERRGHCVHRIYVDGGDEEYSTSAWVNFMVVRSYSPYNRIIGRPGNGHIVEQQDYSTRMYNGFRTRGTAARNQLSYKRKNSADMTEVSWHIADHRLNIRERCLPVRQKKRRQAPERNKAIYKEVEKLVDAGIMKEVHYHSWLSNPVMVKKHDGSWRMCVDLKDLNKACHKDGYPLPEIDCKVESLCGYPFKYFLDGYKGYHQIKIAKEDEEKTTFITSQWIFCYSKMSFGFKNAGETYQRLVDCDTRKILDF